MTLKNFLNLNERRFPVTGNTKTGKKLLNYRGIRIIIVGESPPPDVHGIPKGLEAYGRGGEIDGNLWIDGGSQGSTTGHPNSIKNGFYWGADYDAIESVGKEKKKGAIYLRGRAGTSDSFLENNLIKILDMIFKKLPRP